MSDLDFQATKWWRVMRNGKLWAETSSEHDARSRMEPGDTLERLYERTEQEWIEVITVATATS